MFLIFVVLISDILLYIYEIPEKKNIKDVFDIIWWNVVTLTTVGYGDIYPSTAIGKWAAIVMMLTGIATLAYILSEMVENLITINKRKELGLMRVKMENHIIVCNWNERAEALINELISINNGSEDIVVIDDTLETTPLSTVRFIKGNPANIKSLNNANVRHAAKVVILGKGPDKSIADSQTVLTTLAIKSINPDVFICAEIIDPENTIFLKNARVDQIIDVNSIVSKFIAQTTINPSLLAILSDLVSNDKETCEIYKVKLPENLQQLNYMELVNNLKCNHDCIVIALEDCSNNIIINPKSDHSCKFEHCFVIAKDQPFCI